VRETDEIFKEMKENLERRTGVSVNAGGDMALRLYAVAAELETLWAQVEWTRKQCFPQTASGECLDFHATARGLKRASSTPATGYIRFEIDSARNDDIIINSGMVCLNAAGLEFITTSPAVISAGEICCMVPAAAKIPGTSGNVPARSITYMSVAPVGIARCYNPTAFSGGTDAENDDSLRVRILKSYESLPNGSNKAYYESEAMNTDGVAAASVVPRSRGLGTVDVVISSPAGVPDENLINKVREKFQEKREICVDVAVLAPQTVYVPVSVAIDVNDGYEFNTVAENVRNAIAKYFDGRLLGQNILLAKLGYLIFGVEGVSNYVISQPSSDVQVLYDQLPVSGEIKVTRR